MTDKPAVTAEAEAEKLLPCKVPKHCRVETDNGRCVWVGCHGGMRLAVAAALAAKDAQFIAHTDAVKAFLGKMLAVYDPCADETATISVKDVCAHLVAMATDDRQRAADRDARIAALEAALAYFMLDDRFQVSVGGNPNVVERMLAECRDLLLGAIARTALSAQPGGE